VSANFHVKEGMLLRYIGARTVYVVKNLKLYAVSSAKEIDDMGKTFDDVVVVKHREDLELIPYAPGHYFGV